MSPIGIASLRLPCRTRSFEVVDTRTLKVQSYILVGQRVWDLALTPEEDLLFTTNGVSNDVTVIDAKTHKAIKSIKVGRYPWGAAVRSLPGLTAGWHATETR